MQSISLMRSLIIQITPNTKLRSQLARELRDALCVSSFAEDCTAVIQKSLIPKSRGKYMALIYIIEDDQSIREIELIALKNSNYNVAAFDRADKFFQSMEELLPDLVLLDIMLPDQDGYEIIRKLRKNPLTAKIPVIMVTARTTEFDLVRGLDSGADDYIRKPFSSCSPVCGHCFGGQRKTQTLSASGISGWIRNVTRYMPARTRSTSPLKSLNCSAS